MELDVEKFIQCKITQLVEPSSPKNIDFTNAFENEVENKLVGTIDVREAFRNVALAYAAGSSINLDETEIDYAADLYVGVNPRTKGSLSNGHENKKS